MGIDAPQATYATQHITLTDNTLHIEVGAGKNKVTPKNTVWLINHNNSQLDLGAALGGFSNGYHPVSDRGPILGGKSANHMKYKMPERIKRKENIQSPGNSDSITKTAQADLVNKVNSIFLPDHLQGSQLSKTNTREKEVRLEKLGHTFYPEFGELDFGDDNRIVGKVTVHFAQEIDKLKMQEFIGHEIAGVIAYKNGDEHIHVPYVFEIDYTDSDTNLVRAYRKYVEMKKVKISRTNPGGILVDRSTKKHYTKNQLTDETTQGAYKRLYVRNDQKQIKQQLLEDYNKDYNEDYNKDDYFRGSVSSAAQVKENLQEELGDLPKEETINNSVTVPPAYTDLDKQNRLSEIPTSSIKLTDSYEKYLREAADEIANYEKKVADEIANY